MFVRSCVAFGLIALVSAPAAAQMSPATLDQMAATPLVTVHISEQLRAPPDQASISATTEAREPTASAALAANKLKTEQLLGTVRSAGIGSKDVQTEGVSVSADYQYETIQGRSSRRLNGYVARNTVRIKTREIDRLTGLLDTLTGAGATEIYGPSFSLADTAPLRKEARRRAMIRGEAEAGEYAHNAGFTRVRLLAVEEGISYNTSDIVVTGTRIAPMAPPPPPPPPPPGGSIEPGQIETGVTLTLRYRMER